MLSMARTVCKLIRCFIVLEIKSSGKHDRVMYTHVNPTFMIFYILEKMGFTGLYLIFLFLIQNIHCGYSLEPTMYVLSKNDNMVIFFFFFFFFFFFLQLKKISVYCMGMFPRIFKIEIEHPLIIFKLVVFKVLREEKNILPYVFCLDRVKSFFGSFIFISFSVSRLFCKPDQKKWPHRMRTYPDMLRHVFVPQVVQSFLALYTARASLRNALCR